MNMGNLYKTDTFRALEVAATLSSTHRWPDLVHAV